jgi:hypothetical protein
MDSGSHRQGIDGCARNPALCPAAGKKLLFLVARIVSEGAICCSKSLEKGVQKGGVHVRASRLHSRSSG